MSTHPVGISRAPYCEMTVSGTLDRDEREPTKLQLTTPDGCKFRVAPVGDFSPIVVNSSPLTPDRQWRVIPITQTDGTITRLQLVGEVPTAEIGADKFECVGRTAQVNRKHTAVSLKIERQGGSIIRPTLLAPPLEIQSGHLWHLVAQRVGTSLAIVSATQVSEPNEPIVELPTESAPIAHQQNRDRPNNSHAEIIAIARTALAAQQLSPESREWQLKLAKVKEPIWEWEASSTVPTPRQARVRVNSRLQVATVFIYPASDPDAPQPDPALADRLIVTPLGAARGIGASCFRVQIGPYEIVMDAGTRPKGSDPLPAFELLEHPNLILITHAHLDHIGALPIFHRDFPDVPMISTHGTREIARVMLTDGLKVQNLQQKQGNEDFGQVFSADDLDRTLFHLQTQPVGVEFSPLPGLKVRFIHAGHIVGAACIYLEYGERSLLYTGDYNTTTSRTAEGLKLADLPQAQMLITESTYGADTHPSRRTQESELIEAIVAVVRAGGNVLIPAFALGRAQEIILALRTSAVFHSANVPVYVDGLVREVTDLFAERLELLPAAVQNFAKTQSPFFCDKSVKIVSIGSARDRPLAMAQPSVIIASSGMLTGGASIYYAKTLLERENAAVFISGYTDEESPGRLLQGLEAGSEIELDGTHLTVRAKIQRFNLSAHADRVGITQVIHRVDPQHLILIHGSQSALHELAKAGDLREKYWIHIPEVGDTISFGQAPEHLSKVQVAKLEAGQEFEIEIEAEFDGAWLRIADTVLTDPRWQHLSATGLLSAKWTKGGLMLKPASHKSLAVDAAIASGTDCCAICEHFDGYLCRSEESPLYKRDVDPLTKCSEFHRQTIIKVTDEAEAIATDLE